MAAGLVGAAEFYLWIKFGGPNEKYTGHATPFNTAALVAEVILGFLTFTGSLMAAGKLMEIIPTRPIVYKGQNAINLSLLGVAVLAGVLLVINPALVAPVPDHHRAGAGVRRDADYPHRRGRYADGDRPVERLRRPVGRGDGLRA